MNASRSTFAVIALSAIAAGCAQHMPPPPASPSIPNSSPEVPPPSSNPTSPNTPDTNPNVPPGSSTQPNPSPPPPKD
jgi:hypothetical protein